jgi:acyl carrier protein
MDRMSQIMDQLENVFKKVFNDASLQVSPQTTAADVKDWTSLNHMHLITEIEEYFNCEFSFDEVVNFKNVGDIASAIQNKS